MFSLGGRLAFMGDTSAILMVVMVKKILGCLMVFDIDLLLGLGFEVKLLIVFALLVCIGLCLVCWDGPSHFLIDLMA